MSKIKYRPSNSSEGMWFTETFCDNCYYDEQYYLTLNSEDGCEILARSLAFEIEDKEYPEEWTYVDGKPTCTKFRDKELGEPQVINPNQLTLFNNNLGETK